MKCIGFGPHEGKCDNEAGTARTPYWCQRCDDLRVKHISRRLESIKIVDETQVYGNECPSGRCEF